MSAGAVASTVSSGPTGLRLVLGDKDKDRWRVAGGVSPTGLQLDFGGLDLEEEGAELDILGSGDEADEPNTRSRQPSFAQGEFTGLLSDEQALRVADDLGLKPTQTRDLFKQLWDKSMVEVNESAG